MQENITWDLGVCKWVFETGLGHYAYLWGSLCIVQSYIANQKLIIMQCVWTEYCDFMTPLLYDLLV